MLGVLSFLCLMGKQTFVVCIKKLFRDHEKKFNESFNDLEKNLLSVIVELKLEISFLSAKVVNINTV